MNKLLVISCNNNRVYYGLILKDNRNNIIYDVIASDNIYKDDRRIYSLKMNNRDIEDMLKENKKNVYFTTGIRPPIKKLQNAILSKTKLFQMDITDL
jgi:hypothetical protein